MITTHFKSTHKYFTTEYSEKYPSGVFKNLGHVFWSIAGIIVKIAYSIRATDNETDKWNTITMMSTGFAYVDMLLCDQVCVRSFCVYNFK